MNYNNKMKNIIYPLYNRRSIYPTQLSVQSMGRLQVRCITPNFIPIANALVRISYAGEPNNIVGEIRTDGIGLTEIIELPAPNIEYSLQITDQQPYSEFNLTITADGYEKAIFSHVEILPSVLAIHEARLTPIEVSPTKEKLFVILPHTLYYEYPPKIPEDEIKPMGEPGEIVLKEVVVPEFVIVHDGAPTDPTAANHYVRFKDYIKNVASSEIYATWPESTIYANVFAILSFTLNRVFTEWYRNQGYNFTITSSTAYDHKWINGRNIFDNINFIVDSVFTNYLSRPNVIQPILTQYCDGNRVQCPGWMTQWGSKDLGDQGYTPIQILRHFYGESIYINSAQEVAGVPRSWPGSNLTIGSQGDSVRTIQEQLNRIADAYSAIPKVAVDGVYGQQTADAVRTFQRIFNHPETGVVDFATWYKISHIYVAVTRMAE
jgi:peptidoglycan hydrolase-like protein with peptidoglycan-binding domain